MGVRARLRHIGRKIMEIWLIGALAAAALLVYLVHALLRAEAL